MRGTIRIKLNRPLQSNERFVGAATVAALASVFTDDETLTFAVDEAETVVENNELWLIARIAVQGESAHLNRIAYQATVILLAADVDLVNLEVAPALPVTTPGIPPGTISPGTFGPSATINEGQKWYLKITLSGTAPRTTIIDIASSQQQLAPVPPEVALQVGEAEHVVGPLAHSSPAVLRPPPTVTFAASLNGIEKFATLKILPIA